ncbi:proteasome assembly chaperone 4 family protein [Aspergillus homomorphus CBS 101889]|uniref:Proteasome assembly chaperone 3 n=1 Tax=Aspergillus homomorphus (strain CBS 101889) TaxID=1450537 RepID=A0A395I9L2_ASPHC|nr:hypothetical protein BO97DRAFT_474757 [Aspergillus homomorphus CBS 101889]RAL16721.1 hypothetical protein BO97DRAFT_474757 [Aspergillus homomorphus CBS 101889]
MATAMPPRLHPQEISFPLPQALHTTAHIHLTRLETCAMVFLATSTPGDSAGTVKPMGSLIYAMPDLKSPTTPLSTTLYTAPNSLEYTTRVAKILARRLRVPVYVGSSIDPASLGLQVEEEMAGLRRIVEEVVRRWEEGEKKEKE